MGFEDEVAILIERYDRFQIGARFQRVHQEYIRQALALPPERKYDGEGGPGVRQVIELLKTFSTNSEEDI